MHSPDIKELKFAHSNPQFIPHLSQFTLLVSYIPNKPTNMFTALRTLADTASSKNKLLPLSPMSNITEPGSPFSDMDISSSSNEKMPPSLLFKIDLEDEEEEDQLTGKPILPNISDLFDITPCPNQGLWDKNRTEAMDQLTNKTIMEFGKMMHPDPNLLMLTMTHKPEKQMSEPYKDWMPSPHTWNNGVPRLPMPPSDMTTLDDKEAQTGITDAWPLPPSLPLKGTDMQPPIEEFSGAHPGHPWEYNTIGSPNYFRLLIPDPAMPHRQIVAPYIKYNSDSSHPEISGTFCWKCTPEGLPTELPSLGYRMWIQQYDRLPIQQKPHGWK